jgi:uncharacterized Zn-finger protein
MQPSPAQNPVFVDPPEVISVESTRVACDGGGGALGHPLVFMEMGDSDFVECGYCDRRFVLRGRGGVASEAAAPAARAPEDH